MNDLKSNDYFNVSVVVFGQNGYEENIGSLHIVSGQKNEKTNDFGSMLWVFLGRFGGYLGVLAGGFWKECGGVFRKLFGVT